MPTYFLPRLLGLILICSFLWGCGAEPSTDSNSDPDQAQYDSVEVEIPVNDEIGPEVVDTVTGTIKEVVDDGKENTKEPCNDQIRSQIASQQETIKELKEILAGESDKDVIADISAEIKQSEDDVNSLRERYDCE